MPDRTADLLVKVRQHHLPGLNLGDQFIYPNYAGGSILNLPTSVCRWLGVPEIGAGPLTADLLDPLGENFRRVILIVMDALALHRMQRWMANGLAPVWRRLLEDGSLAKSALLAPLTSIVPSTTSAALTSLWTGASATEHAITGYEMWMKEYGVVANTILHTPSSFRGDAGSLMQAGFDPVNFLPFTPLGMHLAVHGVASFAFQHASILHSGLSQMFFRDVKSQGFLTASDLWVNLRMFMERQPDSKQYIYVYWSEIDTFSHRYGPDDERTAEEFNTFGTALERLFLERLSPAARQNTLLVLIADHGQIATRRDPHYELRNHASLTRRLHILPSGENRLAYFFIRPGQTEAVLEYLERTWPDQFAVLDTVYAVETGLFGPGTPHPRLLDRLGDVIVTARGDAYLWWADKENHLIGRHGGLHPEEMLVPFLAASL